MTEARWYEDWRPGTARADFARRVMAELAHREREVEEGWGAPALRRRRAWGGRRGSSFAVLGLAAVLVTGAALGSLGSRGQVAIWSEPTLLDAEQEGAPIVKPSRGAVRLELLTERARSEPERARPRPRAAPPRPAPPPPVEEPPRVVPIHYPPCHCSSGAVVCSCVD